MPSDLFPDWTITLDGTPFDPRAGRVVLLSLVPFERDGDSTLEWFVRGGALPGRPDPYLARRVTLSYDIGDGPVLAFDGEVVSAPWSFTDHGWGRHYTAKGGRYLGDLVPHTDSNTGGDATAFNLAPDDRDYIASRAGRTAGQILLTCLGFAENAAALDALGVGNYSSYGTGATATATIGGGGSLSVTVDDGGDDYTSAPTVFLLGGDGTYTSASATVSGGSVTGISVSGSTGYTVPPEVIISTLPPDTVRDLVALDLIPPQAVYFQGEKLLGASEGVVKPWAPNHSQFVLADGTLRFLDQREFGSGAGVYPAAITLAMNDPDDLVDVGGVSIAPTTEGCFTRVVVRGGPEVEMMVLSLVAGDLEEQFGHDGLTNSQAKDAWTIADFESPETTGANDAGSCSCTSTTEIEVTSDDASRAWGSNYWDQTVTGRRGVISLIWEGQAGITTHVTRRIIANDALTAGGTATITVDRPVPHTDFDRYVIFGQAGSGSIVWRRYGVADPEKAVRVQSQFPFPVPLVNANGNAVALTSTGVVRILYSDDDTPPFRENTVGFDIDRATGVIDLIVPSVTFFSSRTSLEDGGSAVDGIPSDVQAILPVAVGALTAACPADAGSPAAPQYDGTAFDDYGIERTLYVTVAGWRDAYNSENMERYACELLDTVKDTALEGTVPLRRFDARFLTPGNGIVLTGTGYTTDYEGITLPVVGVSLHWGSARSPDLYRMELRVSNRREAFSGGTYERPRPEGFQFGGDEPFVGGLGPGGM